MLPNTEKKKSAVYILLNDMNAQYRFRATKFVLENSCIPMYPSIAKDFFDVKEEKGSRGTDEKSNLIRKCDQIWVFGDVNASMHDQIVLAKHLRKKVRKFSVVNGQFVEKDDDDRIRTY